VKKSRNDNCLHKKQSDSLYDALFYYKILVVHFKGLIYPSKIVYSINTDDIQDVANEVLERDLSKKELASVQESVGDYIDWFEGSPLQDSGESFYP